MNTVYLGFLIHLLGCFRVETLPGFDFSLGLLLLASLLFLCLAVWELGSAFFLQHSSRVMQIIPPDLDFSISHSFLPPALSLLFHLLLVVKHWSGTDMSPLRFVLLQACPLSLSVVSFPSATYLQPPVFEWQGLFHSLLIMSLSVGSSSHRSDGSVWH